MKVRAAHSREDKRTIRVDSYIHAEHFQMTDRTMCHEPETLLLNFFSTHGAALLLA